MQVTHTPIYTCSQIFMSQHVIRYDDMCALKLAGFHNIVEKQKLADSSE